MFLTQQQISLLCNSNSFNPTTQALYSTAIEQSLSEKLAPRVGELILKTRVLCAGNVLYENNLVVTGDLQYYTLVLLYHSSKWEMMIQWALVLVLENYEYYSTTGVL